VLEVVLKLLAVAVGQLGVTLPVQELAALAAEALAEILQQLDKV
jgi:hypothetical protein